MPILSLRRFRSVTFLLSLLVACASRSASPASGDATAATTVIVEPDGTDVAQPLLTAVEHADVAVHVAMYLLTNETYIQALEALSASGVDVRVILNRTFPEGTAKDNTNEGSYSELTAAGVPVVWAPTNTGFDSYTHEKAIIIDPGTESAQAWVMTMNLDHAGPSGNREYLVRDTRVADVAEAEAIFEADYADTTIVPSGPLVVAPSPTGNAVDALLALIESATTSIAIEVEELDDAGLEATLFDALTAQAERGVAVRVVLEDSSNAEQATAVDALIAAGGQVSGYAYGAGLEIHAKAVVVDSAHAFVGSENFSGGSLGYNRELGVLIDDPDAVALIESTIDGDFGGGSPYSPY